MIIQSYILPDLILLADFLGDTKKYLEAVYIAFKRDFIDDKPVFQGKRLRLKRYPLVDGKEATFYHFTSKGDTEDNRKPDFRRCERIPWARPVIEKCDTWSLKVWPQKRNGKNRLCIWLELENQPDYIVILDVRTDYILPWTAFTLELNHEKRKKRKEYEEYIKARAACITNGPVTPSTHG